MPNRCPFVRQMAAIFLVCGLIVGPLAGLVVAQGGANPETAEAVIPPPADGTAVAVGDGPEASFAAMTPEQVGQYEDDVRGAYLAGDRSAETMRRVVDLALIPPKLNTSPLPDYDYDRLDYGMTIGIERTPKGRLWAAWVAGEDGPQAFMVAATSDDDGETWSKPRLVIDSRSPSLPLPRSVIVGALWTDPLGRLWFFFDQVMNHWDGRDGLWAAVCENPDADRPEWSEPRRIWHGRVLNKPTVLSGGEWLLPAYLLQRTGRGPLAENLFPELDPDRGVNVLVSTDRGATWQRRGLRPFPNPDWHEAMIVERQDHTLWMLARTRKGIMQSFSEDRGATWSEPTFPDGIEHPVARFHIRRMASGRILMVKHGETVDAHEGRSKLTAWLSEDDGATWTGGLMLDERKGISYPDGTQAPDGTIYVSYDRERSRLGEILMARITEDDILAGKLVAPNSRLKMLISRPLKGGEVLHNGIRLQKAWPPDYLCPQSADPMPVPYLVHPPEAVPIDVGRQLFVDDFLIEETDLRRSYHSAERHQANPVFEPQSDDELNRRGVVYLGQGGLFFDPEDRLFKMYYTAGWRGPLAVATSPDLVTWTRPELSDKGNVLIDRSVDDNAVWLDLRESRVDERVKYMECHRGRHPHAGRQFLYTSADGRRWSEGVSAGRWRGDYSSLFYNPFREKWVFSIRASDGMGRATYYCESPEFTEADWDRDAVYWQGADRLDRPEPEGSYHPAAHAHGVQLYSRPAVAYESLIIGMHQIHRGPENRVCEEGRFPKLTDLEVGFSRDGFHWHRPSREPFLAGTRREGDWDRGYLHGTTGVFVVLGEKLVFPYTGFSGIGPDGSRGMYHGASIGLASLRRDGFASMDADAGGGTLTTRPVTFHGTHLFVNAEVPEGALRAEVLDESGQPIEPFTLANSVPLTGDSTLAAMVWADGSDLGSLRGKPVRFRFELAGGSLYAFWISRDDTGRSDGYLGAGGPGYEGVIDTVGRAAVEAIQYGAIHP